MTADFAAKWFALYYSVLGLLFLLVGLGLMLKTNAFLQYLSSRAKHDKPPPILRKTLKYFFLFTLPCIVLSFFPFSWPELLFSLWSLVIMYIAGIQLVRWQQTRNIINNHSEKILKTIYITAAIMVAVSPVMFLLGYQVIRTLM